MISQVLQDKHNRLVFLESILAITGNFFNMKEATDDFFSEFDNLINELVEEYDSENNKNIGLLEQKTKKLISFQNSIRLQKDIILKEQFTNYTELIIKLQDKINVILFEESMSEKDYMYLIEKQNDEMIKYWQEQKIESFQDKEKIIIKESLIKDTKFDVLDLQFSYLVECR